MLTARAASPEKKPLPFREWCITQFVVLEKVQLPERTDDPSAGAISILFAINMLRLICFFHILSQLSDNLVQAGKLFKQIRAR